MKKTYFIITCILSFFICSSNASAMIRQIDKNSFSLFVQVENTSTSLDTKDKVQLASYSHPRFKRYSGGRVHVRRGLPKQRASVRLKKGRLPQQRAGLNTVSSRIPRQRAGLPSQNAKLPKQRAGLPTQRHSVKGKRSDLPHYHGELPRKNARLPRYRGSLRVSY